MSEAVESAVDTEVPIAPEEAAQNGTVSVPLSPSISSMEAVQEIVAEEQDSLLKKYITACQAGDIVTVRELIESGAVEVGSDVDQNKVSGLHWAAINNRLSIIKYLTSKGAPVDAEGGDLHATPLHWACRYGLVYIVDYLLKQGADPARKDSQGFNCLHLAIHSSNIMLVIYMLICAPKVDIDSVDPNDRTSLHWAAYQGDSLSVDVLLKFKASVRKVDNQGFTPIHWALIRGQKECLKRLIEEGSDIHQKTNDGKDCFAIAMDMNSSDSLMDALYECGYDHLGNPIRKFLNEKWAKVICFFLPYILLGAVLKIASSQNIIVILVSFIILFFITRTLLKKIILPSFILSSSSPLMKSPFMSGIFSASAFWCLVNWVFVLLPNTLLEAPFSNLFFFVCFLSTMYCFQKSMFKDPGVIERPESDEEVQQTIYELLQQGKYDAKDFCIHTFIRKPLRSRYSSFHKKCVARFDHYCPWIYNDVGLRNHKPFMFFVFSLEIGVLLFLRCAFEYFDFLEDDGIECALLDDELCSAWTYARFTLFLSCWCAFQLIWLTFLLFVQTFQISKGLTTLELSTFTKQTNLDSNPYYSSVPTELLGDNDLNDLPTADRSNGRKNPCSAFLFLTGVDQFVVALKQTLGLRKRIPAAEIPFDYGLKQNLIDFWFAPGDDSLYLRNFFKFLVKGEASLGGQTVDYYKLYKFPPKKMNFENVEV